MVSPWRTLTFMAALAWRTGNRAEFSTYIAEITTWVAFASHAGFGHA